MKSVFEWFVANPHSIEEPWLVMGKGPTFSRYREFDLAPYNKLALNDAARELPTDLAHAIDIDVVHRSGQAILANARFLAMPWHPHVNFRAGVRNLEEHARHDPVLGKLASEGRLLWYNLSTSSAQRPDSPVVSARFFSAEAALNLLAMAGVRTIRSIGVDGGASYSHSFEDLKDKSLLANSRTSFDVQFQEIAKTIFRTGIDFAPIDVQSPIRVYVATTEAQMLAVKVLEYSIRKHASMTVSVHPLHLSGMEIPTPAAPENRPRTPFSFQRFLIPQLAEHRGRAIYMDSDMQVFDDVRKLWMQPFNGANVLAVGDTGETGRRPQFSVMLLDCSALDWEIRDIVGRLDDGRLTYEQLVYEMQIAGKVNATIPECWNSLETYRKGETSLLHYTDMDTQPWVHADHPYGHLWVQDLIEAIDVGFLSRDYVRQHIAKGWIRPSLDWQIEHRQKNGYLIDRSARLLDKTFRPPHFDISRNGTPSSKVPPPSARQRLEVLYRRSYLFKVQRRIAARMRWR